MTYLAERLPVVPAGEWPSGSPLNPDAGLRVLLCGAAASIVRTMSVLSGDREIPPDVGAEIAALRVQLGGLVAMLERTEARASQMRRDVTRVACDPHTMIDNSGEVWS